MTLHTALIDLPAILELAGYEVRTATNWLEGQCSSASHYLWTDPHDFHESHDESPSGYMVHHTATDRAIPPPHDTSKANAWIGLARGDSLYSYGPGDPVIYLASAGPARISSGYGYSPAAWEHTFEDRRAPVYAEGADGGTALNRYVFNVETVHPGDGSELPAGSLESVIGLGVVLHELFGWRERTLGHLSWSSRKIDPRWNSRNDAILPIQDEIARRLGDAGGNGDEEDMRTLREWVSVLRERDIQRAADVGSIEQSEVSYWQGLLSNPDNAEWQSYRNAVEVRRV